MDKKKIAIIALVFIFLGTMIFAFANPRDEELKGNSKPSEVDKDKTTDDDKQDDEEDEEKEGETEKLEEENNNTNTVVNTNNGNNTDVVVDYYKLALEAVEKAEASLVQNDVDSAKDLINNVTTDQKDDLLDRINDVQNIIDFDKLLKVLENKTNSSTNKDELNDARDFNISNSIADKLNSLKDSANKTGFEERYNTVLLILKDVNNPVVNGVTEGEYTNRELEIEVVEDTEYVITLDGEAYELGTSIGEGVHVLKVVDKAFNETVVNFTIDRTAPTAEISYSTTELTNKDVHVTLTASEEVEVLNAGTWNPKEGYATKFKKAYNENKTQEVTIKDRAGNSSVVEVAVNNIDQTKPQVLEIKQQYEDKQDGRIKVTIITSEEIFGENIGVSNNTGWIKVSETEYYTYYFRTKDVTLNFTDKAGNPGTYSFTVDKTAPTVVLKKYTKDNKGQVVEPGYYDFSLVAYVEDSDVASIKLNGEDYIPGTEISERKDYVLEVKDKTGNPTIINFTIDKDHPIIEINGKEYKKDNSEKIYFKENVAPIIEDANIESIKLNGEDYISGTEISDEKEYTLEAIDKAGNKTSIIFVIDKTVPSMVVGDTTYGPDHEGIIYSSTRFTATASDLNGVKEIYANGHLRDKIDVNGEGKYTFRLIDMAGNESKFTVIVDKTKPDPSVVEILTLEAFKGNTEYAKSGKTIRVYLTFKEELSSQRNGILGTYFGLFKVNGEELPLRKDSYNEETKEYNYIASYTIPEDANIEEGILPWSVKIFGDMAGNTIDPITKTVNARPGRTQIIYDNTIPGKVSTTYTPSDLTNQDVTVTIRVNEVITPVDGWTLSDDKMAISKTFSENIKGNVVVSDLAGNSEIRYYSVDNIDKESPVVDTLRVKGLKDGEGTTNFKKIKVGDTFQVILTTIEELGTLPVLVVDGKEITDVKVNKFDTYYQYIVSYKIPEDTTLIDGEQIAFVLKGYTDKAGNPGIELTNDNIKIGNGQTEVIFDKSAPTILIDRNITLHVGDNFVDDIREKIFDNVTSVENLYVGGGWGTFKDTSVAGNYHLNYKIMDEAGNYSVATRNITVIEP